MSNDQEMEDRIVAKGLTAPRISLDHVSDMVADRVSYRIEQPRGTTSTFAHAYLDNAFYLATGHTACVSPANFDPDLGQQYAVKKARALASDKLYELEGYVLYTELMVTADV